MMWTAEQWERHLEAMTASGQPVHVALHTSPPPARERVVERAVERTDAFLASHPRTRDELVEQFEQWEHRDELGLVEKPKPKCPLCREGTPEVTVLEQGGDNGARHLICSDCALDRPTVLLPALRPVGEYDVPPCEQCGHDLLTAAHLVVCRPERVEEIGAELEDELSIRWVTSTNNDDVIWTLPEVTS